MSTLYVDNVKTVSGTTTFADGQFGGIINSSATGTFTGTHTGTHSGISTPSTLKYPSGTTANRPGSPSLGSVFYDTTLHQLLIYNGAAWQILQGNITQPGLTHYYPDHFTKLLVQSDHPNNSVTFYDASQHNNMVYLLIYQERPNFDMRVLKTQIFFLRLDQDD